MRFRRTGSHNTDGIGNARISTSPVSCQFDGGSSKQSSVNLDNLSGPLPPNRRMHAANGQQVGARRCLIEKITRQENARKNREGDLAMTEILPILSSIIGLKAARP